MATFNGFADDGTPSPAAQIALDGKVDADDERLSDYRHPLEHEHDPEEVRGLLDRLAALEAEIAANVWSEWEDLPLEDGLEYAGHGQLPQIRRRGRDRQLRGRVRREGGGDFPKGEVTLATLKAEDWPEDSDRSTSGAAVGSAGQAAGLADIRPVRLEINPKNGALVASSGQVTTSWFGLDTFIYTIDF